MLAVGVDRVVLQIQAALGRLDQRQPAGKRGADAVQQHGSPNRCVRASCAWRCWTSWPSAVCSGALKALEAGRSTLLGKLAQPAAQVARTRVTSQRQTIASAGPAATVRNEAGDGAAWVQSLYARASPRGPREVSRSRQLLPDKRLRAAAQGFPALQRRHQFVVDLRAVVRPELGARRRRWRRGRRRPVRARGCAFCSCSSASIRAGSASSSRCSL